MQVLTNLLPKQTDTETSKIASEAASVDKGEDFIDIFSPDKISTKVEEPTPSSLNGAEQQDTSAESADAAIKPVAMPENQAELKTPQVQSEIDVNVLGRKIETARHQSDSGTILTSEPANISDGRNAITPVSGAVDKSSEFLQRAQNEKLLEITGNNRIQTVETNASGGTLSIGQNAQNAQETHGDLLFDAPLSPKTNELIAPQPNSARFDGPQIVTPSQTGTLTSTTSPLGQSSPPLQSAPIPAMKASSDTKETEKASPTTQLQSSLSDTREMRVSHSELSEKSARDVLPPPTVGGQVPNNATGNPLQGNTSTPPTLPVSDLAATMQKAETLERLEVQESLGLRRIPEVLSNAQIRPGAISPLIQQVKPEAILNRVSQSLEATIARGPSGSFELKLHPIELGTVRILVLPTETGLSAVVSAERPEVLDLLRRNSDSLLNDLKNTGGGDVQMSFKDGSQSGQQNPETRDAYTVSLGAANTVTENADLNYIADRGLDIRL